MQPNIYTTLRSLKLMDGCKGPPFPFIPSANGGAGLVGGGGEELRNPSRSRSRHSQTNNYPIFDSNSNLNVLTEALAIYGLPQGDLIEPQIEPCLKSVNFVETLADLYRRFTRNSHESEISGLYLEQCAIFRGLPDPKLFRRSLRSARQHAIDVHSKVVYSAWLRFERRVDELKGVSAMDCEGQSLECPKAALIPGYDPELNIDPCMSPRERPDSGSYMDDQECSTSLGEGIEEEKVDEGYYDMSFCIGDEEIKCRRFNIASLSRPFKAMLYGNFIESRREKINFSRNGISAKAMRAAEIFSRTKRVDFFYPKVVLELLVLANRYCCEEMKSACDEYLSSLVNDIESAMLFVEYGLEESAYLLVATCLQVFLRELPNSLHKPNVTRYFCTSEARKRLASAGHASFLLYYFLSHIAMEVDIKSNTTVMLLERLAESANGGWQKQLAFHQLGCVMLERKEYKDAQKWFDAAVEAGHVYSLVGSARAKFKRGHMYKAYLLMNSLISEYMPSGWMYQERSLYCHGKEKMMDLNTATELDPSLSYPYKFRAVSMVEDQGLEAAISEIDRIIGFKVSPDCLELRAWFLISKEDYEGALHDIRALVTLHPQYMMFHGKLQGEHLVELLRHHVQQWSLADCWMHLHDRWSAVDDIGSLAVIHHMLSNDPKNAVLWFRQSLLLLRLNCHKAAMRSLRFARNMASSPQEQLVYEGWILYDTGHHDEAIKKAQNSLKDKNKRSFEAHFLEAYIHSESTKSPKPKSEIINILKAALMCQSDGLRKGQALSNLADIYADVGELDNAVDCYTNALNIKHTRAHQGLAKVYHLKNQRKAAYDEMTKLIGKARYKASAYEKRSEYCDREMAKSDLSMTTRLDPLRTYPYRYRAAVLMDDNKEAEAIAELTKAISFKPDLQLLHLRAAFHDSVGDNAATLQDCEAALCLDPNCIEALKLYEKAIGES